MINEVKDILSGQHLPVEDVENTGFRVYSINTFETDVQLMFYLGFTAYFHHFAFGTLNDATKGFKWTPYFEKEYEELFTKPNESFRKSKLQ